MASQSERGAWVNRTVVEGWERKGKLRSDRTGGVILVDPAPLADLAAAYREFRARDGTRKRPAVRVCQPGLEPDPAEGPDPIEVVARWPGLYPPSEQAVADARRAGLLALYGGPG